MTFGEKLKTARKEAGYSQEQLADLLMVSRSAVAKWESDKGMPDIGNLRAISQTLSTSIDYLVDDGTKLDMSIVRKPINLQAYTDGKVNLLSQKKIKDKVVRAEYPNAEIFTLIGTEKLTKGEKIADFLVFIFSPLVNIIPLMKSFDNVDNEFYLVNDADKQYLAVVKKEFIESREISDKVTDTKFTLGNYRFIKCRYKVK